MLNMIIVCDFNNMMGWGNFYINMNYKIKELNWKNNLKVVY